MEKKFNAVFELIMQFNPMGYCASAKDAGEAAILKTKLEEANAGRKWAIVIPAGRAIVAAGRSGWIGISEYGDAYISEEYSNSSFFQGNPNRVKNVIIHGILEGYCMSKVTNIFDSACLGTPLHEVDHAFAKVEDALQQFDQ